MTVLAIDTATSVCSTALIADNQIVAELFENAPQRHAELLLPMVDAVMKKAERQLHTVEQIAVSIGPGSFTGLRIGLSVAKGIAFGRNIPIVPVPTLDATAYNAFGVHSDADTVSVILPARRNEYYYNRYRRGNEKPELISDIKVLTTEELYNTFEEQQTDYIAGEGIERFLNDLNRSDERISKIGDRLKRSIDSHLHIVTAAMSGLLSPYYDTVDASLAEPLYIKQFESGSPKIK